MKKPMHLSALVAITDISAKDGIVTLRGEAENEAQKDLTTEYAKDIDGVKVVQNEMTVAMKQDKRNRCRRFTVKVPAAESNRFERRKYE
jgi:osmotically-inducible protein OsmY